MSDLEREPAVVVARGGRSGVAAGPVQELLPGRVASLGPGTDVLRLLPTLGRRMVGAWCFFDHYGPEDITATDGMQVPPHPHTGLQTVSWLLEGAVRHRDSLGNDALIAPGQLALMTAGRGIAHSEQSPVPHPALLQVAQLWVALPDGVRDGAARFEHHLALPVASSDGVDVRVVIGEFDGLRSPGRVHTPLVGLDVQVHGDTSLPLERDFEYAAASLDGAVAVDGVRLDVGSLLYLGAGRASLPVSGSGRLMVLGGEPFDERIVMWWNLVGRSHDEIAAYRSEWDARADRFADVPGWDRARTPAPPLPPGRLAPRTR